MPNLTILSLRTRRQRSDDYRKEQWRQIKVDQSGRCAFCGERVPLTIDHILPRAMGGNSNRRNLRALCVPCHEALNVAGRAVNPENHAITRLILALEVLRAQRDCRILIWLCSAFSWLMISRFGTRLLSRGNHQDSWPTAPYGFSRQVSAFRGK
jgi:hypothetical protein